MVTTLKTNIAKARKEVAATLKRYGVAWQDVARDQDEAIWQDVEQTVRAVRKANFRKRYPSYGKALFFTEKNS